MLEELKATLKKSQEYLDDIADKLEDEGEDLSEDITEVWQNTRPKLQHLKQRLAEAGEALHTRSDEARLQAHLAIMDAGDAWEQLSETVTELSRHAATKGSYELQHANLQAHLAAMEARDFMNTRAPEIRREFHQAADKVEETSRRVAQKLERSLENLGDIWARSR